MKRTSIKRKRPRYPSPAQEQERREWAAQFPFCWLCGVEEWQLAIRGGRLETHEIGSRGQCPGKWADVRNYARVCSSCHSEVLSWLSESIQCALKKRFDPDNYDRSFINQIRGRADTAIENHEVENWCRFIKALRG